MMAQLKAAAVRPSAGLQAPALTGGAPASMRVNFADALKNTLDQVNTQQQSADKLGQRFSIGDDSVNLSDVMIATQKASISFQTAVQVRNKLVSAYHDILNLSI
jgi:flagellar hook-basal body complex protein FliE